MCRTLSCRSNRTECGQPRASAPSLRAGSRSSALGASLSRVVVASGAHGGGREGARASVRAFLRACPRRCRCGVRAVRARAGEGHGCVRMGRGGVSREFVVREISDETCDLETVRKNHLRPPPPLSFCGSTHALYSAGTPHALMSHAYALGSVSCLRTGRAGAGLALGLVGKLGGGG